MTVIYGKGILRFVIDTSMHAMSNCAYLKDNIYLLILSFATRSKVSQAYIFCKYLKVYTCSLISSFQAPEWLLRTLGQEELEEVLYSVVSPP